MFSGQNELAEKIKDYIEERVQAIKARPASGSDAVSDADEIRKYKALSDDGIISREEFEQKKKQLLGL
jgi:multidrug resistance efflux pump